MRLHLLTRSKVSLALALCAALFCQACNDQTATRQFLTTLDDAEQVSLSVKQFVEQLAVAKKLAPDKGIAIVETTERLDLSIEFIANESRKYLVPVLDGDGNPVIRDGKPLRVVRFTEAGKTDIQRLVFSASGIANGLIDDPAFADLKAAERENWKNISGNLARVIAQALSLVKQIKPVK